MKRIHAYRKNLSVRSMARSFSSKNVRDFQTAFSDPTIVERSRQTAKTASFAALFHYDLWKYTQAFNSGKVKLSNLQHIQ